MKFFKNDDYILTNLIKLFIILARISAIIIIGGLIFSLIYFFL